MCFATLCLGTVRYRVEPWLQRFQHDAIRVGRADRPSRHCIASTDKLLGVLDDLLLNFAEEDRNGDE